MHKDDLPITDASIRELLMEQVPHWADLPLCRINSSGTDNALFQIGDGLVLRLPRRATSVPLISKELDWLPRFGGLPLEVPRLRYRGYVNLGVKCEFGIFDWIKGEIATLVNITNPEAAAVSLATFLNALHTIPIDGAPSAGAINSNRGVPLAQMKNLTFEAIKVVSDEIDALAAMEMWISAETERYEALPVWLHGDIKADNLLVTSGELSAVIDWGLSAVGDPAADYAAAWSWVDPSARQVFRQVLDLNDGDWLRSKAWALYGAVIALSYYRGGGNEQLCQQSRLTLDRLGLLR